jgi:bifunctional non-homologous end joining protein LigD
MNKEIKIGGNLLKLTNLNKVYFPDDEITKGDLIEYYRKVSKYMLPYLKGRPESLNRHPNGINGDSFYQKDVKDLPPDWIHVEKIYSEHHEKDINYLVCNYEATLVYLANLGCIEINPWFSRVENLRNPDYLVLDLDPEDISFDKVVEAAHAVKEVLDAAGAKSYCKTSGATGLHIYVPLNAEYDYDVAKDFAHLVAQFAHHKAPSFTSLERSPSKRQKKVYLDYLQNRPGQTLAAPYSVRPRSGATVATPLKWSEVKKGLDPKQYHIKNIMKRLSKTGDIFKPVLGKGIDIEKCIGKLEAYAKKGKKS